MSLKQISIFLESKPGHLTRTLDLFEQAHVNVRGYSASDTGDYGVVRFILDNPDAGMRILEKADYAATEADVIGIRLEDTPGELARVIKVLSDCKINVDYSYSLISTYIVVYVKDCKQAEHLLEKQPIDLLSQDDMQEPLR
jgi:hypothetical protein